MCIIKAPKQFGVSFKVKGSKPPTTFTSGGLFCFLGRKNFSDSNIPPMPNQS